MRKGHCIVAFVELFLCLQLAAQQRQEQTRIGIASLPFLSLPFFPSLSSFPLRFSLPLPFTHPLLLEVDPFYGVWERCHRCKLPQRSPSQNRFLCILALQSDIWWQQF